MIDFLAKSKKLLNNPKNKEKFREGTERLDKFLIQHPQYSDVYVMRAIYFYGIAGSKDYTQILDDLNKAIRFHPMTAKSAYENTAGMYGWRVKVYKETGNLQQAMKDLETAVEINYYDAIEHSGASPNDEPKGGNWGKRDFDEIIRKYPKDYRGYLFRAVYYSNFGILLKPEDYQSAISDLNKAVSLNPKCAMAYYMLGTIMDRGLIFSRKSQKEYQKEAQVRTAGLSIWNAYPEECKKIYDSYTNAIESNPKMVKAYLARASLLLNTQKSSSAIKDYDKVIELDPDNGGAYNDRGLAYSNIGNYWTAVDDFTHAIDAKKKVSSKYKTYVNRAKAYSDSDRFNEAIADYTKAIELHTGNVIILQNLSKFRLVYPEYRNLGDKILLTKLRAKYFPNMDMKGFSDLMLHENKDFNDFEDFEIYENRGDTYLKYGHFSKGIDDYKRAIRMCPNYLIDRWKYVVSGSNSKCYLDIKTVERAKKTIYNFWLKYEYPNAKSKQVSHTIQNTVIDCASKRINTLSYTEYDSEGKVMSSRYRASGWDIVIPDTIGEVLYNGWCKN